MRIRRFAIAALAAASLVATAARAEVGLRGIGPRVGVSEGPDQILGGVHFDLGEFAKNVRWQPSVEIGGGDHVTTLLGNFMVAYYFPIQAKVTPYAGGEVSLGWFRYSDDPEHGDDTKTRIGPAAVGGIEMKLKGTTRFLAELQVGFSDVHDVRAMVGWTF